MGLNKYESITQTLIGDPLINIVLGTKAVPPADLTLMGADFTKVQLYGSVIVGLRRGNFVLSDVPIIRQVGLWCNIADGLVQNSVPDDHTQGLVFRIDMQSYNSADVEVQPSLILFPIQPKVPEFNALYDADAALDMSVLSYSLTGQPSTSLGSGYFRMSVEITAFQMDFSTITVDPAFAGKQLIMRPMVVVEHTFPFLNSGF